MMKLIATLDDDQSLLDLYKTSLEDEGYQVEAIDLSSDTAQLLDNIRRLKADMLILDVHIPGINSFRVLKCMQENTGLSGLPVLICSASRPSLLALRNLLDQTGLPMPLTLEKPFDLDDLSRCVTTLIGPP